MALSFSKTAGTWANISDYGDQMPFFPRPLAAG